MSRRRDRARRAGGEEGAAGGGPAPAAAAGEPAEATRRAEPRSRLLPQLALLTAVFAVAVIAAELAGAANLGVSLGVGQVAFAVALVVLFSRR